MDTNPVGTDVPGESDGPGLQEVVAETLVAEFTTVRNDRPATVPVTPFYDRDRQVVVVSSAPAFPGKVERAAGNASVGMVLYGPNGPVHLTGRATVRDDDLDANAHRLERLLRDLPSSRKRRAVDQFGRRPPWRSTPDSQSVCSVTDSVRTFVT